MNEREAAVAMINYNKARKAYTYKLRNDRVKGNKSTVTANVQCSGIIVYTYAPHRSGKQLLDGQALVSRQKYSSAMSGGGGKLLSYQNLDREK